MNVTDLITELSAHPGDTPVKVEVISDGGEISGQSILAIVDVSAFTDGHHLGRTVILALE